MKFTETKLKQTKLFGTVLLKPASSERQVNDMERFSGGEQ